MVSEIRLYVEGGGAGKHTRTLIRKGFGTFLQELVEQARGQRIKWSIIACGSRWSAFEDFQTALRTHPDAFNLLLVEAEAPVQTTPWRHLQQRDAWPQPPGTSDDHCHLMVQMMEAWLMADKEALRRFYGQGFSVRSLPGNQDVEQIDRSVLERALREATRHSQRGEYHKIQHGPALLEQIDAARVRAAARHCARLFAIVEQRLNAKDLL